MFYLLTLDLIIAYLFFEYFILCVILIEFGSNTLSLLCVYCLICFKLSGNSKKEKSSFVSPSTR